MRVAAKGTFLLALAAAACGGTEPSGLERGAPPGGAGGSPGGAGGSALGGASSGSGGLVSSGGALAQGGGPGAGGALGQGGGTSSGGALGQGGGPASGGGAGAGSLTLPSGGIISPGCSACATKSCPAQLAACAADPKCVAVEQCMTTCAFAQCGGCALGAPPAFGALFSTCINTACPGDCPQVSAG